MNTTQVPEGWFLVALMEGVCIEHAPDEEAARAMAGGRVGVVLPIVAQYPPLYGPVKCRVCGRDIPRE